MYGKRLTRRKFTAISIGLVGAITTAGCGDPGDDPGDDPVSDPNDGY